MSGRAKMVNIHGRDGTKYMRGGDTADGTVRRPKKVLGSQARRYVIAGIWNTIFGYALFALLFFLLPAHYLVILSINHVISVTNAYITHRVFVFRVPGSLRSYFRFHVVYAFAWAVNVVLLWVLVEMAGLRVLIAQLMATVVTVVMGYLGHKMYTFK